MSEGRLASRIGQRISLPGHFDVPVILEEVRPLGASDGAGYECRVRLPDGSLEEAVISAQEAAAILGAELPGARAEAPVDAEKLRLLIESARTTSGGRDREPKVEATRRYELASKLTAAADHVLLLTATPHHGDEDKFAHFLRLIDPDLFPEPHRLQEKSAEIRREVFRLGKDSPWCLRRLKEDLRDINGKRLFPDRHAKTVTFRLNSEEYLLYKSVTAYINEFIPQQTGQRRSSAALTRTVLQRRLVSSTCAIHESLKRRLKKQEDLLEELEELTPAQRARRLAALQGRLADAELDEDDLDDAASDYLTCTYQMEWRARCQADRQRFAQICREYLERSFKARIDRAQERAMLLAAEAVSKPEFKLAADEARKYVDELERARRERLEGLKRLETARTGPVRHVGTAIVLSPDADAGAQLADLADELDPEVRRASEIAAEDHVVEALMAEGFPRERIERVGRLKLGFDIRAHRVADAATGEVDVKRIEVKGRRRGQSVRLTTNEWYKAQQLAETYWLYVVWDPLSASPELVRIQNPAVRLDHAKREIVAARFYEIPAEAIETAAMGTEDSL